MPFPSIEIPQALIETLTYATNTGGSYDNNGQWSPGSTVTTTFNGVILPLNEKDLNFDLGGTYTRSDYKLYTTEILQNSQIITHNNSGTNESYEIQEQDDRLTFANYRKYIIRRVEDVNE